MSITPNSPVQLKEVPVTHTVKGVVFKLKGFSKASGELFYSVQSSQHRSRSVDALPSQPREGFIGGSGFQAPLPRATADGVAFSAYGLRGEGAVEASLAEAAKEIARADKRRSAEVSF